MCPLVSRRARSPFSEDSLRVEDLRSIRRPDAVDAAAGERGEGGHEAPLTLTSWIVAVMVMRAAQEAEGFPVRREGGLPVVDRSAGDLGFEGGSRDRADLVDVPSARWDRRHAAVVVEGVPVRAPDRPFLDCDFVVRHPDRFGFRFHALHPEVAFGPVGDLRPVGRPGGTVQFGGRRNDLGLAAIAKVQDPQRVGGAGPRRVCDPRVVGRPVRLTMPDALAFRLCRDLSRRPRREVGDIDPRPGVFLIGFRNPDRRPGAGEGDLPRRPRDERRRADSGYCGERQGSDGACEGKTAQHRRPTLHQIRVGAFQFWT